MALPALSFPLLNKHKVTNIEFVILLLEHLDLFLLFIDYLSQLEDLIRS